MGYRPLTDIPISLFTSSNVQANGYVLKAYLSGTSTPTPFYSDNIGTSAGPSVTLDARGEPTTIKRVWINTALNYKIVLETDLGAVVWTVDPVYGGDINQFNTIALATSASLSTGEVLRVYGYAAAGDMPPADYIVVAGGTGTNDGLFYHNMTNGRQLKLIHGGTIYVAWAGAVSGEFGALMSTVLQSIRTNSEIVAAEVVLPHTAVTATTPINATNLNAKAVTIRGPSVRHINNSLIKCTHNGVGMACTGSRSIKFSNFSMQCSDVVVGTPTAGTVPTASILLARTDPGASIDAGYHVFDNVYIDGHCSTASVYSYASEVINFYGLFATNRHSSGKPALHVTQDNDAGITCPFTTIATGTQSNSTLNFNGGQLWSTGGGAAGRAVQLRGAANCRFRDTFVNTPDGLASFFIDGNIECTDITIDGVREENAGASGGPLYSIYYRGTVSNLSVKNYASASKQTSGYFMFGEASSTILSPKISNIQNAYANNGIEFKTVQYPDVFYVGKVTATVACSRGRIHATPITITTAERTHLYDLTNGQTCNLYKTLTASIANGATVDVNLADNYPSACLISYIIQSNQNSGHLSIGLIDTNAAGGTSNTLNLSNQRENNVAVTIPAANTVRITNNTGGAAAFYVRMSVIAG